MKTSNRPSSATRVIACPRFGFASSSTTAHATASRKNARATTPWLRARWCGCMPSTACGVACFALSRAASSLLEIITRWSPAERCRRHAPRSSPELRGARRLACTGRGAFAPRVIRRCFALLACAAALPLRAQPGEILFTADRLDATPAETRAIGHARFGDGSVIVTADEIRLDNTTRTIITALGHIVVTRGAVRLLADRLVYHRDDGTFTAEHVRMGAFPYYVAGESASGTAAEITVNHATATYGEPGPWQPALTSEKIIYASGQRLRTESSTAGIGDSRFLPFPQLTQDLHEPLASDVSVSGGVRRSPGGFGEG